MTHGQNNPLRRGDMNEISLLLYGVHRRILRHSASPPLLPDDRLCTESYIYSKL